MKNIALIMFAVVLTGCPAQNRLYVHNKGNVRITHHYSSDGPKPVVIKPGRTHYFFVHYRENACFDISVGDEQRAYLLTTNVWESFESTGYGSRLDASYEYDRFFVLHEKEGWLELERAASCDDV